MVPIAKWGLTRAKWIAKRGLPLGKWIVKRPLPVALLAGYFVVFIKVVEANPFGNVGLTLEVVSVGTATVSFLIIVVLSLAFPEQQRSLERWFQGIKSFLALSVGVILFWVFNDIFFNLESHASDLDWILQRMDRGSSIVAIAAVLGCVIDLLHSVKVDKKRPYRRSQLLATAILDGALAIGITTVLGFSGLFTVLGFSWSIPSLKADPKLATLFLGGAIALKLTLYTSAAAFIYSLWRSDPASQAASQPVRAGGTIPPPASA